MKLATIPSRQALLSTGEQSPAAPWEMPDEPSDLDFEDPYSIDDEAWDVFVADGELDPLPEPGDFRCE